MKRGYFGDGILGVFLHAKPDYETAILCMEVWQ